jgi:hypothetical protein
MKILFWVILLSCAVEGCAMLQKIDSTLQRMEYLNYRAQESQAKLHKGHGRQWLSDPYTDEQVAAIFAAGANTPLERR